MQFDGRVKSWDDDRGIGIIEPMKGGQDVSAHIIAFPRGSGRPYVGQRVAFEVELGLDGSKRAKNIEIRRSTSAMRTHGRPAQPMYGPLSLIVVGLFAAVYVLAAQEWEVPTYFAAAYLGLSLACYLAYAAQQAASRKRGRAVSERHLLLLGMLGGWPGGLVAQCLMGQRSAAGATHMTFWATVCVNVAAFTLLSAPQVPFLR